MLVYHYNPHTKELLSSSREPRVPAYSTKVRPPSLEKGKVSIFDEQMQTWSLQADHRGTVYTKVDGLEVAWQEIGVLPNKYTTKKPPKDYSQNTHHFDEKTQQWQRIQISQTDLFSSRQTNLRKELLSSLNNPIGQIDSPLLTCMLLSGASQSDLPLAISKNSSAQTEQITNITAVTSKEAQLRADLLVRYKRITDLIQRVNIARSNSELDLLEEQVRTV